jgi:hypothetical protein
MSEYFQPRRNGDRFIHKLINLWPLIIALISVIAMATTVKNKVDDHENRISKLERSMERVADNTDRLVTELLDKKYLKENHTNE